jgi:hypothetical protein
MLTLPLPHVCFFHFSDTCSLGFNGYTKFLEALLSLIPFQRSNPTLVLECYVLRNRFCPYTIQHNFCLHLDVELWLLDATVISPSKDNNIILGI